MERGELKRGPALLGEEGGEKTPKLADVGISHNLSCRAQKLTAVSQERIDVGGQFPWISHRHDHALGEEAFGDARAERLGKLGTELGGG